MRRIRASLIAFVVSSFFLWHGWGYYSKGKASEKWPTVAGKILESEVVESTVRANSSQRMYEARVRYEYEVNGQRIKGDQVSFINSSSSNRSHAADTVNRLPVGKEVPVHYDPMNPHQACLFHQVGRVPWIMMFGGMIGLFVSFKTLLFGTGRRH